MAGDVPSAGAAQATTRAGYLQRWSELHGGVDPHGNRLVLGWLTVIHALASPLARAGWSPNAVTTLGLGIALLALPAAAAGGGWLWAAALLILISGVVDSLDGAIAVMTGRTTKWGFVWDSVADRISDVVFVAALWFVGAPAQLCVAVIVLTFLLEYTRARAVAAGMNEVGVLSVWERPSRVLVCGMFLLAAAVNPAGVQLAGGITRGWPSVMASAGVWVALVLSVVGFIQVLWVVRSRMRAMDEA